VITVGFGFGSEGGTKKDQADFRGKTYYKHYFEEKEPHMQINQANFVNRMRNDFNLSSKFQYGSDQKGGPQQKTDETRELTELLKDTAEGYNKREQIKEKLEKQNYHITQGKKLENSQAVEIGTHGGKGIENNIDIEDLKRSHWQDKSDKQNDNVMRTYQELQQKLGGGYVSSKTNQAVLAQRKEYNTFKVGSLASKVPFSPDKRNRLEKTY